jgi:hypothetical protein
MSVNHLCNVLGKCQVIEIKLAIMSILDDFHGLQYIGVIGFKITLIN